METLLLPETALAGAILVTGTAAFAPVTIKWVRQLFPSQRLMPPTWGAPHVLLAGALWIGFHGLVGALVAGRAGADATKPLPMTVNLVAAMAIQATICVVVIYWARRCDPGGLRRLGLHGSGSVRAAWAGFVAYLFSVPGLYGLGIMWPWLMQRMGATWTPQEIAEGIGELAGAELTWIVALAVVVIPFCEELLFRGFLQPVFVARVGPGAGVVLASVVFGALHGASQFLPIFGLALVLGGVMLHTQRLAAVWFLHALHNGTQLVLYTQLSESTSLLP
ncbi:MAG: CPBP family intramembrane metalloprotease [bacterium]|nr:CPBP family intramembrane metalloprotease [bacterium]